MLIIPLYGTIIDKINILKNLNITNYETDVKIAIYTGIINSDIKRMCSSLGIKLVKSLKFSDGGVELSMVLPKTTKTKLLKNSRRSREDIKRDILNTISDTGYLNITHIMLYV